MLIEQHSDTSNHLVEAEFHPIGTSEDLDRFNQEWVDALEPNNPDSYIDFPWRVVDVTRTNWRQFTNRYWLLVDGQGQMFHVSQNIGVDAVKEPPLILVPSA